MDIDGDLATRCFVNCFCKNASILDVKVTVWPDNRHIPGGPSYGW